MSKEKWEEDLKEKYKGKRMNGKKLDKEFSKTTTKGKPALGKKKKP